MTLQTEVVEATAHSCVQEIIGTVVASSTPLMEAGIDSLGATELQRALGDCLSTEFEATLLFDHPSIDAIASRFDSCTQVKATSLNLPSPFQAEHSHVSQQASKYLPCRNHVDRHTVACMKAVQAETEGGYIEWKEVRRP